MSAGDGEGEKSGELTVLALDCSSDRLDLALLQSDGELHHRQQLQRASVGLVSGVADLLTETGSSLNSLSKLVVGLGPGSFTGLRVSLAYAHGLAYALDCPLVGSPSFPAAAQAAYYTSQLTEAVVAVVAKATKDRLYFALYRLGIEEQEELLSERVIGVAELADQLEPFEEEGFKSCSRLLVELAGNPSYSLARLEELSRRPLTGWRYQQAPNVALGLLCPKQNCGAAQVGREAAIYQRGAPSLKPIYVSLVMAKPRSWK